MNDLQSLIKKFLPYKFIDKKTKLLLLHNNEFPNIKKTFNHADVFFTLDIQDHDIKNSIPFNDIWEFTVTRKKLPLNYKLYLEHIHNSFPDIAFNVLNSLADKRADEYNRHISYELKNIIAIKLYNRE